MPVPDAFESALRRIDQDPHSIFAIAAVYTAAGQKRWSVSALWKYDTAPQRQAQLSEFLAERCDPEPEDLPLLKQLLAHKNRRVAESAALLLVRLQGNAALRDIAPVLKRFPGASDFTTPLLVTIGELRTPEAEKCLFGDPPKDKPEYIKFSQTQLWAAQRLGTTRLMKQVAGFAMVKHRDEADLRLSIVAVDVLAQWPNKASVLQYLEKLETTCLYPADARLLRACLGDSRQYDFLLTFIISGHKAGWYEEEAEEETRRLRAAWKAKAPKLFSGNQDLFQKIHVPETLHLAVRAARVLRIRDALSAIRHLLKSEPNGCVLYDEALFTYAALCGFEHIDDLLSLLRVPPDIMFGEPFTRETAVKYFIGSLCSADYACALAKFTNAYIGVISADKDDDAEYAVQAIELLIARRLPESVVLSTVRMIHKRSHDEQRVRPKDRLLTLIGRISRASRRRFLDITVPVSQETHPKRPYPR
jgi:hypothetical protein